jgi:V8-like Glu-specific endopeptidase
MEETDRTFAIANTNPEAGLTPGEKLTFGARQLLFEGDAGARMPLNSQLGLLLALSVRDDDGQHTTGSAVMVGPGLALCAAHVLNDQGYLDKSVAGNATFVASAPTPDGLLLWTILRVATVPGSDLAVLSMQLTSDYPKSRHFNHASITTRMPAIGDVLTVTGLSAVRRTEVRTATMQIDLVTGCAKGKVIDRYPDGRDKTMLPGPCLAVECKARGGMSGGPVFDSRGFLVGVVSSSYEGSVTTFVSHVWPALVRAQACPVWPRGPYPLPSAGTLLHLGRRFGVYIDRPDAFELCVFNGEISLNYSAWS